MGQHGCEFFWLTFKQPQRGFRIVVRAAHTVKSKLLAPHDMERQVDMVLSRDAGHHYAAGIARRVQALVDGVTLRGAVDRDVDAAA